MPKTQKKTANPKYSENDLQAMVDVMEYATNKRQDRTEFFFVSGVNCDPTTARDEMMIAKSPMERTRARLCVTTASRASRQAEVTPEAAHEVGREVSREDVGRQVSSDCRHPLKHGMSAQPLCCQLGFLFTDGSITTTTRKTCVVAPQAFR